MNRRSFLRGCLAAGVATSMGGGFVTRALAGHGVAHAGTSPWGPPDHFLDFGGGHGLWLPGGFDARIVGRFGEPVAGTGYPWHAFPDGAACFATGDGGWILVSNSEMPLYPTTGFTGIPNPGGVGAVRFAADGTIVDAYPVLVGTKVNCAGGPTPWGTWLTCEEWDGGGVWECDPAGLTDGSARRLHGMGSFAHEAAAVDPVGRRVYLTEDEKDGLLYRFTPAAWPDLATGLLEAAEAHPDGTVTWHPVPEPNPAAFDYQEDWLGRVMDPSSYPHGTPTRHQVPAATRFNGGEGCWYHDGLVHVTTKGDHRVWRLDVSAEPNVLSVIHDPGTSPGSTLRGVDNLIVHATTDHIFVAEDGGDMEIQVIVDDSAGLTVAPVVKMVGPGHTRPVTGVLPDPLDTFERSEVTGLAFSPDGRRLYCSSQRYDGFGITYEIFGPWDTPTSS